MTDLPPYTGRTVESAPPVRLRWGAIVGTHLPAMLVVYLVVFVVANGGFSWFGFLFYGAVGAVIVFAGVSLLVARITFAIRAPTTRSGGYLAGNIGSAIGAGIPACLVLSGYGITRVEGVLFVVLVAAVTALAASGHLALRVVRATPARTTLPIR